VTMIICNTLLTHANENQESAYYKEYFTIKNDNKRAQRALGRSPEEKVKGQGEAIILL